MVARTCSFTLIGTLLAMCSYVTTLPANLSNNGRIIGGAELPIYNSPWQASLQISARHECGGVVYSDRHIITAAHCLVDKSPTVMRIRVGSNTHNGGGTLIVVEKYLVHEKFNPRSLDNDIALIRLAAHINLSLSVKAINLATSSPAQGSSVIATGWGYTEPDGTSGLASSLQSVQLQIIERAECGSSKYGYGLDFVTEHMICATSIGNDTCQGDAGGPLVANGLLVGIVSWGYGCGQSNYPGVYADIATLRSWIVKTANEL